MALASAPVIFAQTRSTPGLVVPTFPDLTIKQRHAFDTTSFSRVEVLYLKGARQRRESLYDPPGNTGRRHVIITQCDQRQEVQLNPDAKLFAIFALLDWSEQFKRARPLPEAQGADVTTTFDAVDTGERRRLGSYVARRVRTTITVEPSRGANTPASTREIDGWYIELPGLGCSDAQTTMSVTLNEAGGPGTLRDRHHYKTKGTASRGYAIEETSRFTQRAGTNVDRLELIELSEDPLDWSLFEVPGDYRPALPLPRGGHDMSKPDTIANRLHAYWEELTQLTRAIFR